MHGLHILVVAKLEAVLGHGLRSMRIAREGLGHDCLG